MGPELLACFSSKVSAREKERGRGRRERGGKEEVLGGRLALAARIFLL